MIAVVLGAGGCRRPSHFRAGRGRAAGVGIADIGGEEFREAIGRALAGGGYQGRGAVGENDEMGHYLAPVICP